MPGATGQHMKDYNTHYTKSLLASMDLLGKRVQLSND